MGDPPPTDPPRKVYPTSYESLPKFGIPVALREGKKFRSAIKGTSTYTCPICVSRPPYATQNLSVLWTHMRRIHLNIVLACPLCETPSPIFSSKGWEEHVTQAHEFQSDKWYVKAKTSPPTATASSSSQDTALLPTE